MGGDIQNWVIEVFEDAEEEKSGLFEERREKRQRSERRRKAIERRERPTFSCISFWIAACRMMGLKSLLM